MRIALTLIVVVLFLGCTSAPATPSPAPVVSVSSPTATTPSPTPASSAATHRGVSLSPKSYNGPDFTAFFDEAKDVGDVVLWGGSGDELGNTSSAAYAVSTLAHQKGLRFAAQTGWQRDGIAFDIARQSKARADVLSFVRAQKPEYLVLGVELDRIAEKDPAYIDALASWYPQTYDEVKAIAPDTQVFVSFQLERISGHTGGLYGGPASSPPRWDLLDKFPERDMTGFTTYPGLVFQDPDDIPADLYTAAAQHAGGPIAITEAGHFAKLDDVPGWASSADEQARFARRLVNETEALDAPLVVWLSLHDQPSIALAPFQTMGLIDVDGHERPAHDVFAAH